MPFSLRSMTNLFEATRSTEHGKIVSKSAANTISFYSETPYLSTRVQWTATLPLIKVKERGQINKYF